MGTQTLGYYDLMNIAEQNSEQSQRDANKMKLPSYKGSKNKKEDPKSKALSDSVRKFLAKKEDEKRRQEEEQRRKREHLMEMRNKDKKAKGRVNRMLKLTKSANKSAIEDANECLNDSIVDQHNELQPDDDDYGYVSQASIDMHKKLLEQYKTIKKSTPAPVSRYQNVPVPEVKSLSSRPIGGEPSVPKTPEKKTRKQPPKEILSYHDLLNLANEKKDIPPEFPVLKAQARKEGEEFDYGRPMTAKEKATYEAEKALRDRVARQVEDGTFRLKPASEANASRGQPPKSSKTNTFKIPVKGAPLPTQPKPSTSSSPKFDDREDSRGHNRKQQLSEDRSQKPSKTDRSEKRKSVDSPHLSMKVKTEPVEKPMKSSLPLNPYMDFVPVVQPRRNHSLSSDTLTPNKQAPSRVPDPNRSPLRKDHGNVSQKPRPSTSSQRPAPKNQSPSPPPMKKPKLPYRPHNENEQHRQSIPDSRSFDKSRVKGREPTNADRGRDEPRGIEERRNSKMDVRKSSGGTEQRHAPKNYPPPPMASHDRRESRTEPRNYPPPPQFEERRRSKVPEPSIKKGRQVIESDNEEEYDSEMDDFIDDSDCNPASISAMIRQITGYDKRRYRPEEEEECMETSAYDQMREESRSLRIGIKEDLEDMRLEEEERKRKLMKQKQTSSPTKKKSK